MLAVQRSGPSGKTPHLCPVTLAASGKPPGSRGSQEQRTIRGCFQGCLHQPQSSTCHVQGAQVAGSSSRQLEALVDSETPEQYTQAFGLSRKHRIETSVSVKCY